MKRTKQIKQQTDQTHHPVGASFFVTCTLKGAFKHQDSNQIKKNIDPEEFIEALGFLHTNESIPTFLEAPEIARILLARIESNHMRYYRLIALTILPNCFQMVIDTSVQIKEIYEPGTLPKDYVPLSVIVENIKTGTARYIAQWRNMSADEVWENENIEIHLQDEKAINNMTEYILDQPIRAGLAGSRDEHAFTFVN